jgi:hypothetical protein
MRLQLVIWFTFYALFVSAQNSDPGHNQSKTEDKTQVDFLFSYYQQEGNNSAVTGGVGTEKLTDVASNIIVNVPLQPLKNLIMDYGVSYYSSASSDNINPNTISSASSTNLVFHIGFTTIKKDTVHNSTYGVKVGGTHQNNFGSLNMGAFYTKQSENNNCEFRIQASFDYDKWALYYKISKLYPVELKGKGRLVDTDKRYSYNLSLAYKQILTSRLQAQWSAEFIYQTGLLSTPFHRVYFVEESQAKLERLPSHRLRVPLTMRLNYFVFDRLIIRSLYRYYFDDFDLHAHTFNLELPVKITNFFSVYPFYNYHTQTAAQYFREYKAHLLTEQYYTSDYDLSGLYSTEWGGGIYYSPVTGIAKFRTKRSSSYIFIRKFELRYAYYKRSTGLHANIFSTHFSFAF